jgi:hypothetical protein
MGGTLFIEFAILFPTLLAACLAHISVVDYLGERAAIHNTAHAIAMALQSDPSMDATKLYHTVLASSSPATTFVQKKPDNHTSPCNPGVCRIEGLEVRVVATKEPTAATQFTDTTKLDATGDDVNWKNPHRSDNVGALGAKWINDTDVYYVGVQLTWEPQLPFLKFLNVGQLAKINRMVVVPVKTRDYTPTALRFKTVGRHAWNHLFERSSGGERNSYCDQVNDTKCTQSLKRCTIQDSVLPEKKRGEKISEMFKEIRDRPGCLRRACRGAFGTGPVVGALRVSSCNLYQSDQTEDPRDGKQGTRSNCPKGKLMMKVQCFFSEVPMSQQTVVLNGGDTDKDEVEEVKKVSEVKK